MNYLGLLVLVAANTSGPPSTQARAPVPQLPPCFSQDGVDLIARPPTVCYDNRQFIRGLQVIVLTK